MKTLSLVPDLSSVRWLWHTAEQKSQALRYRQNPFHLKWPCLLSCLGLDVIYFSFPLDLEGPLFPACLAGLEATTDKEDAYFIYDRLFAEVIKQFTSDPSLRAASLLQNIQIAKQKASERESGPSFLSSLLSYEQAFQQNPADTVHDLILYLAWDRMCLWAARLFDIPSNKENFVLGIQAFKECLIESYLHIRQQGRTKPGVYRMLEALFYFQMREEQLQKHSPSEWELLSRSFPLLRSQEEGSDCFYIDDALLLEEEADEETLQYLTTESAEQVKQRLQLAHLLLQHIKRETVDWNYALKAKPTICFDI